MKTAKRYVVTYDDGFIAWEYRQAEESDKGENIWIKESDYAALAAEVERLKFEVECIQRSYDFMTGEASDRLSEILRLEDENERLRKAGDELAKNLDWSWEQSVNDSAKAEKEWKAAKEGGRK